MTKRVRRLLIILLALIFAGSMVGLIWRTLEYRAAEETYAEAEDLVKLPDLSALAPPTLEPEPSATGEDPLPTQSAPAEEKPVYVDPYADALREMDFTALQEVNPDVLGWILIPGTVVSYPLLQGSDNDYYLNHTWRLTRSAVGAIFMEHQNSSDLSDFNTIIYGHRMRNGSMFATLKNYKNQSYWAQHPCVYLTDESGSYKYEIFAAYEISTQGETYRLGFQTDEAKQAFLDYCMEQSVIETGITPTVYDQILTLSTCTGNGHATRWVVQAVRKGAAPAPEEPEPSDPIPAETAPQEAAPVETVPQETAPSETVPQESPAQAEPSAAQSLPEHEPETETTGLPAPSPAPPSETAESELD